MNYEVWFVDGGYCIMSSEELNLWIDNNPAMVEKFYLAR